jgi:hypothetical protein
MTPLDLISTFASLALMFFIARFVARQTVVYRRNSWGVVLSLFLSGVAVVGWGLIGLFIFIAGTLSGAWSWIREVESANRHIRSPIAAEASRGRGRRSPRRAVGPTHAQ